MRGHDEPVSGFSGEPYELHSQGNRVEISAADFPPLRMRMIADREPGLMLDGGRLQSVYYRMEACRGYDAEGLLWSPGYFRAELTGGREAAIVASTEPWEIVDAASPGEAVAAELDRRARLLGAADPRANAGEGAELVLAADQFIIQPKSRLADAARAAATGDEIRTVIAGYYWFGDWGRDTMISLEGLTLCTGRHNEAGWILRTFANYVQDGLIPESVSRGSERRAVPHRRRHALVLSCPGPIRSSNRRPDDAPANPAQAR